MDPSPPLAVPLRICPTGARVLWTATSATGLRVGVAFTSVEALRATMGPGWAHEMLALTALHALLDPLAVAEIIVDPDRVRRTLPQAEATRYVASEPPSGGVLVNL